MKIGILGLANSGKTTVFNALTGLDLPTTPYITTEGHLHEGVVKVPDDRLRRLAELLKPPRVTPATVIFMDYLGISRGDPKHNQRVLEALKEADAFLYVIRAFDDPSVVHPFGRINPLEDLKTLRMELILTDLDLVEKRLQRIEELRKKGKEVNRREEEALRRCLQSLESETPLNQAPLTDDDREALRHLYFFTVRPEVVLINLSEAELKGDHEIMEVFRGYLGEDIPVLTLSAKIEMEIAQLPEEDRAPFLREMGIQEPVIQRVIRTCYRQLGLISFFTFNEKELRAWTVREGTTAWEAAGRVHSDIQRGFIKAEVIGAEEFLRIGSMAEARQRGLLRLEGKRYIVTDGDIINFRFNV